MPTVNLVYTRRTSVIVRKDFEHCSSKCEYFYPNHCLLRFNQTGEAVKLEYDSKRKGFRRSLECKDAVVVNVPKLRDLVDLRDPNAHQ